MTPTRPFQLQQALWHCHNAVTSLVAAVLQNSPSQAKEAIENARSELKVADTLAGLVLLGLEGKDKDNGE